MMKQKIISTAIILLMAIVINAQTNQIVINSNINLPKDSMESSLLIVSLNNFLKAIEEESGNEKFILPEEKIETLILLDELSGIQKNKKLKSDYFYKPYLKNVIPLKNNKYLLQISYLGIDKNTPLEKASLELIATKTKETFLFSSPLLRNTKHWQTLTINNIRFHFKGKINKEKVKEYEEYVSLFDKKLKIKNKTTELYCTENLVDLFKLIGVHYLSDYNGREEASTSYSLDDKTLIIHGNNNEEFNDFDPHDLWHDRLSILVSRRSVNRPVDEACAYLYGGSWGFSWEEILTEFMTKVASNKNSDWADYKENRHNFGESDDKHLMVDYVVNALIVQKIENEKGFSPVWELLNCGKYEKGNDNYYKALEKITGISKSNYNEEVWKLIYAEMNE